MRMPEFNAEASLSNTSETYRLFGPRMNLDRGQVVPAEVVEGQPIEDLASVLGGSLQDIFRGGPVLGPMIPSKICIRVPKICLDKYGRKYNSGYFLYCPKRIPINLLSF
jgi:hypothetical protein